jgi:hypothetical protein
MSMLHSLACSVSASVWLHDQQLELADLRQDLIDEWIAAGLRMRRRVRLFLAWLRRAKVTGALDVDWDDRPAARPAIDDEQRFGFLRQLLHDEELDLRDRFGGSVLTALRQKTDHPDRRTQNPPTSERPRAARLRCGSVAARSRSPSPSPGSRGRCANVSFSGPRPTGG